MSGACPDLCLLLFLRLRLRLSLRYYYSYAYRFPYAAILFSLGRVRYYTLTDSLNVLKLIGSLRRIWIRLYRILL